jgi:hypothetical protein
MTLLRSVAGHIPVPILRGREANEEIRELNIYSLIEVIVGYRCKWTRHWLRTNNTHIPNVVYQYIPTGRGNVGRLRKNGETNTHDGGTSLDDLHSVAAVDGDV